MHLRAVWAGLGWFVSSIFSFTQGGSYFGFGRVLIYIANACMGLTGLAYSVFFSLLRTVCASRYPTTAWKVNKGMDVRTVQVLGWMGSQAFYVCL
jgi:hypothetical protein